ncbi:hypothetical protein DKX38_001130 [Salix brachista]|uniref:Uncharacterized protein n=2 Tax=Salix brachista TaxID=2182728 RepID=A0A5N5P575_9ROSI|nr:hypothetical protein DKX38_001130 [Salix brachista]
MKQVRHRARRGSRTARLDSGTTWSQSSLANGHRAAAPWLEHMAALGRTLKMLSGSKTRVLAASEVRFWTGECLNELASQGFEVVEVPSQEGGGDGGGDIFAVYNIIPPCEENCQKNMSGS